MTKRPNKVVCAFLMAQNHTIVVMDSYINLSDDTRVTVTGKDPALYPAKDC